MDPRDLAPAPTPNKEVAIAKPALKNRPGFRAIDDVPRSAFVGGASGICADALQSGDFLLGLACAGLLVIGSIVLNRNYQNLHHYHNYLQN